MDGHRFDTLAKRLTRTDSRRGTLRVFAAAVAVGVMGPAEAFATCKKVGKPCDKNGDCCDGFRCKGGTCRCKPGRANCSGACKKIKTDWNHCGACGNSCSSVPSPFPLNACCGGQCTNTFMSAKDCGACGHQCKAGEVCDAGSCCVADGEPCGPASTCCEGVCLNDTCVMY